MCSLMQRKITNSSSNTAVPQSLGCVFIFSWNTFIDGFSSSTYVEGLSDFQRFSLPAVNQEIGHSFVVDLHVRNPEKELLLWKLWKQNKSIGQKKNIMCTFIIKQVKSKETFITFLMVWKTSSTARGMTPGTRPPPIMVKVFPEDVCPYANMVPGDQIHTVNVRSNVLS